MPIKDIAYPRQVILITSRSEVKSKFDTKKSKKDNIMTLSWHSPVSFNPELYAIMIGKQRFSYNLIKESKVFCVNFMPYKLKKEALFCGRITGENIDKFREAGLIKEESDIIDCPKIKQATGTLECEVIQEIEAGDHIIFIGKVLKSTKKNDEKKLFQLDGDRFTTTL